MNRVFAAMTMALAIAGTIGQAQEVGITPGQPEVRLTIGGQPVVVSRVQDTENTLTGPYALTSRACPPACITPMRAAPGVETLGELEVLAFLQTDVQGGTGLLVDARLPEGFSKERLPGAVNVPFTTLDAANPFRDQILIALGAREVGNGLDFRDAKRLVLYCDGPWCDSARKSLRQLVEAGYPADRLFYYRGGVQAWLLMGLSVQQ